ncbi:MAG: serine hydrolase [Hyphomicrobiaceae bacterium]
MGSSRNSFGSCALRGPALAFGCLCLALATLCVASAAHAGDRHAAMVLDANTGHVLYQSQADAPRHPASLTKMMTLYLVFEQLKSGRLKPATRIRVSANAAGAAPSNLDLDAGDSLSLLDAMKAIVTKSANDVAVALAEHIGGTEANFARLMTAKARALGMKSTVYHNASGLPDPEQVTTARDMLTLALRLQDDFPEYYPLFSTRSFTYDGKTYRNHNTLLGSFQGTDGIKTGYTRSSGFNVVVSVHRGEKHLVGVVFGGTSAAARNVEMRTLINMTLVKASTHKTRKPVLVARAAVPRAAARRAVAAVPAPRPAPVAEPAPVERTVAAAAPAPQAAQIRIARVRPLMMGAGAQQPPPGPGREPAPSAIQPAAFTPPSPQPPPAPAYASAAADPIGRLLGAEPSTFGEQAARLARGEAPIVPPQPVPARRPLFPAAYASDPRAPVAYRPDSASDGYELQVGAFASVEEAERHLATVAQRADGLLNGHRPVTPTAQQGDRQVYRARFAGFDAASAAAACLALRHRSIDCFVARAQ